MSANNSTSTGKTNSENQAEPCTKPKPDSSGYGTNSAASANGSNVLRNKIDVFLRDNSPVPNDCHFQNVTNSEHGTSNIVATEFNAAAFQRLSEQVAQNTENLHHVENDLRKLKEACFLLTKASEEIKRLVESENRHTEECQRQIDELQDCKRKVEQIMLSSNQTQSKILMLVNEQLKQSTGPVIAAVRQLLDACITCAKMESDVKQKYDTLNAEAAAMNQMSNESLLKSEYLDFKAKYTKLNRNFMAGLRTYLDRNDDTRLHELLNRYQEKLVKFDEKAEKLLQEGLLKSQPTETSSYLQTIEKLEQRIAQLEKENSKLQIELDACKSQLAEQADRQLQQVQVLSNTANEKDQLISSLKSTIEDKNTIIADRVKDIKRLESKLEKLKAKTKEIEEKQSGSDRNNAALTEANRTLNERCEEQSRHISSLYDLLSLNREVERMSVMIRDEPSFPFVEW